MSEKAFSLKRQRATSRLTLVVIATLSERFNDFAKRVGKRVVDSAGDDGRFDDIEVSSLRQWYTEEVGRMFSAVGGLIQRAMEQGVLIGLSTLGNEHSKMFIGRYAQFSLEEDIIAEDIRRWSRSFLQSVTSRFEGENRTTYSQRLWALEQRARQEFDRVMLNALVDGVSAWDTAKLIEGFLRAGADCPQWLYSRLYPPPNTVPKGQRPTRTKQGLISGSPCSNTTDEPSVAYAALRLARTEIAWVAGQATYQSQRISPFVTGTLNVLSNTHPKRDICDDVTANNPHPLGSPMNPSPRLHPPHHPNCLCTAISASPPLSEVTQSVKAWVNGGADARLDRYASELGYTREQLATLSTSRMISSTLMEAARQWLSIDASLHQKLLGI